MTHHQTPTGQSCCSVSAQRIPGHRFTRHLLTSYLPNLLKGVLLTSFIGLAACRPQVPTAPSIDPIEPPTPTDPNAQTSAPQTSAISSTSQTASSGSTNSPTPQTLDESTGTSPAADTATTQTQNSQSCRNPQTQLEMNQCAAAEYAQADRQLNQTYEMLQASLSDPGKQALTQAELAWIGFRDLDCAFARAQYAGGSIEPLIYNDCLANRTDIRTTELKSIQLPETSHATADTQLNQTYQDVLAVLGEGRSTALISAQLAWIEYRDRNCAFEVIHSDSVIEESQCLARMSEVRTDQLRNTLEQASL
ncbi:MAG: lysozyme inhibitor LprI family protein [Cyanobacteria bacterium J06632_3]